MDLEATAAATTGEPVAQPETRGLNFHHPDPSLRGILGLYLDPETRAAVEPHLARQAASGLYNAVTALLMAAHATALDEPWRAEAARLVLRHRLGAGDPLDPEADDGSSADALLAAFGGGRA